MENMDKRLSRRSEFRKPLQFELSSTMAGQRKDPLIRSGMGIDISASGLGMETDFATKKGDIVRLLVPLAGSDVKMPVLAEVQWVAAGGAGYRAGVRFLA